MVIEILEMIKSNNVILNVFAKPYALMDVARNSFLNNGFLSKYYSGINSIKNIAF